MSTPPARLNPPAGGGGSGPGTPRRHRNVTADMLHANATVLAHPGMDPLLLGPSRSPQRSGAGAGATRKPPPNIALLQRQLQKVGAAEGPVAAAAAAAGPGGRPQLSSADLRRPALKQRPGGPPPGQPPPLDTGFQLEAGSDDDEEGGVPPPPSDGEDDEQAGLLDDVMQSPEEGGASRRKVAFHPTVTVDVENEGGEAAAAVAAKRLHIYLLHVGIERSIVVRDHVEFEICTGFMLNSEEQTPVLTSRRYSDFRLLREKLIKLHPALPKLPSKTWGFHAGVNTVAKQNFGTNNSGKSDKRLEGLSQFIEAVVEQTRSDGGLVAADCEVLLADFLGMRQAVLVFHTAGGTPKDLTGRFKKLGGRVVTAQRLGSKQLGELLVGGDGDGVSPELRQSVFDTEKDFSFKERKPDPNRSTAEKILHSTRRALNHQIETAAHSYRNAAPKVPKRVRKMLGVDNSALDASGAFRAEAAEEHGLEHPFPDEQHATKRMVHGREMVQMVDLWEVYLKLEGRATGYMLAMLIYTVFWVLLMAVIYRMPSSGMVLKQTEAISDLLFDEEFPGTQYKKNFHEIMTEEELWQWVDGPLTNAVFADPTLDKPIPLLGNNWLLGPVQLRQSRVVGLPCTDEDPVRAVGGARAEAICFPVWDISRESTAPFGRSRYNYTEDLLSEVEGSDSFVTNYFGTMFSFPAGSENSRYYGTGGFAVDLPRNRTAWLAEVASLKEDFIDLQTRAVTFTMNLHNSNEFGVIPHETDAMPVDDDSLIFVQAVFQIEASGHIEKRIRITPIRPMRYFFYSGEDGVFLWWLIVGAGLYLLELRKMLFTEGFKGYFQHSQDSSWNRFEWLFFLLVVLTLWQAHEMKTETMKVLGELGADATDQTFIDLAPLRLELISMRKSVAWLSFFACLKFMKFMNLNEQLSFLWRVIGHAKWELLAFLVVFLLILTAFALLFSMLIGGSARNAHNVPTAFLSLMRLTVGILDFDYDEWKNADPTFAPVILVLFVFLIMLTASNIFIAILTDAYSRKKGQVEKYVKYKKMLRMEGTKVVSSVNAAASLKGLFRVLFPKYSLQVPTNLWPRPAEVGVEPVYKVEQDSMGGGASMLCLHYHNESLPGMDPALDGVDEDGEEPSDDVKAKQAWQRVRRLRRKRAAVSSRNLNEVDLENQGHADSPANDNALHRHDVDRAVFLKIHSLQMHQMHQTLVLSKLRQGEAVELRGTKGGGFVTKIKLRFVQSYRRERVVEDDHHAILETGIDYYANFEVVDVLSWERFKANQATALQFDNQGWSDTDDKMLLENMKYQWQFKSKQVDTPKHRSLKELSHIMDRKPDELLSRIRYIQRFSGAMPPKVLAEQLCLSRGLWLKLWFRAFMDPQMPQFGLRGILWQKLKRWFTTKRGVEKDVDDFLKAYIAMLKRKCNMRDLERSREVFAKEMITVDEFAYRMQLFLYTTGRRKLPYLLTTYSDQMYLKWLLRYLQDEYKDQIDLHPAKVRNDGAAAAAIESAATAMGVGPPDCGPMQHRPHSPSTAVEAARLFLEGAAHHGGPGQQHRPPADGGAGVGRRPADFLPEALRNRPPPPPLPPDGFSRADLPGGGRTEEYDDEPLGPPPVLRTAGGLGGGGSSGPPRSVSFSVQEEEGLAPARGYAGYGGGHGGGYGGGEAGAAAASPAAMAKMLSAGRGGPERPPRMGTMGAMPVSSSRE